MRQRLLPLLLLLTLCTGVCAQSRDTLPADLYRVKPIISLPVITAGFYFSQQKLNNFRDKPVITQEQLNNLDPNDVPGIDRWGLRQDFEQAEDIAKISDGLFVAGQLAPFTLFAWKKYRQDWVDISLMYLEAQMVQGVFYGYAPFGPAGIDRYRPRVYYEETELGERTNGNASNSTFSGHVSSSSTGWYFLAKMVTDHNPDLTGGQKALVYGAATVPGVLMGVLRVKALKHFPTDSAIGLGVGALSGIMVPEFHRWWQKKHQTKALLSPLYGGGAAGLGFSLQF